MSEVHQCLVTIAPDHIRDGFKKRATGFISQAHGFTVVQLVVVVAVVGILGAAAKPMMQSISAVYKQRAAVAAIKQTLIAARTRAMSNPSVHCGVYFELSGMKRKVGMFEDTYDPASFTYQPTQDKRYRQPVELAAGVTLSIPPNTPNYPTAVIFRGDGSAHLSGRVVVATGFRKDTIDVLASTGRVKVMR
jgi:Tfp pilus assembly protein FimT